MCIRDSRSGLVLERDQAERDARGADRFGDKLGINPLAGDERDRKLGIERLGKVG